MNTDELLKLFAILPPVIVGLACLFIITKWKVGRHVTVSHHAAQHKAAYIILASSLIIGGAMYYSLLLFVIGPKYFSSYFWMLLVFGFACQVTLALVPAHPEKKNYARLHTAVGIAIACIMFVFACLLALEGRVTNSLTMLWTWVFIGFTVLAAIGLFTFRRLRKEVLVFQILYAVLFWVLILMLTHLE